MEGKKMLDPIPAVGRLLEASQNGKLQWDPTADRRAFVTSVGGEHTFRIQLETRTTINEFGNPDTYDSPRLDMLDDKGKLLWDIEMDQNNRKFLWELYEVARRIGNRLDERLDRVMKALDKL